MDPSEKQQETSTATEPEKKKPKQVLPTPRISFKKQLDLLRAWAATSGTNHAPVTAQKVATLAKIHPATLGLSNAFFIKIGLLVRSSVVGLVPAPEVFSFNSAHQWNPENAAKKLAPIFKETWFAKNLLPKLEYASLNEAEAIELLGAEAEVGKECTPQLRMLLEYLNATGLLRREGNKIFSAKQTENFQQSEEPKHSESTQSKQEQAPPKSALQTMFSQSTEGVVQFNISVRVDMSELSEWQPDRIAAFFAGLAQVLAAKGNMEKNST